MQRLLSLITLVALGGVGWLFLKDFKIEGLEDLSMPFGGEDTGAIVGGRPAPPPPRTDAQSIRVASFNIEVFGDSKAGKQHVMDILADVMRQFDVVAIQEIRTKQGELMLREFVRQINAPQRSGQPLAGQRNRHYDFLIGPRLGRSSSKEQYAFLYDQETVEVDRSTAYTIRDPDDLLHREPLVAHFRTRGADPNRAFTFTLINIHTDPDETTSELSALAQVYQVVRQASGGEDDVILLGDLNVGPQQLGPLGTIPGVLPIIQGVFTNSRQNAEYDNIVLHGPSTIEYLGSSGALNRRTSGVLDVMRRYNLRQDQTDAVSDHFPVWAEFSIYEQRAQPSVATSPGYGRY